MTAVALLDRDGTINVKAPEGEYIAAPDEVVVLDGAADAIRALNDAGIPVAVVTNQRGIALGLMSEDDLREVHARLAELLAAAGARVDAWLYCPHGKGVCTCRKPEPGMLLDALHVLGGNACESLMVGDSDSDLEAGRRAGVPSVRVRPDGGGPSLLDVVRRWLAASA